MKLISSQKNENQSIRMRSDSSITNHQTDGDHTIVRDESIETDSRQQLPIKWMRFHDDRFERA